MLSRECLGELRSAWLPNITDAGLDRLLELLDRSSPLLISGCFTRAIPMGCLASQAAWNHPATAHLNVEAGITWLHQVAGLNPATFDVDSKRSPIRGAGFEFHGKFLRTRAGDQGADLDRLAGQRHGDTIRAI